MRLAIAVVSAVLLLGVAVGLTLEWLEQDASRSACVAWRTPEPGSMPTPSFADAVVEAARYCDALEPSLRRDVYGPR